MDGDAVFFVLEEIMPKRFGGQAGDYQLLSEPGDDGITHYLLAINPSLGPIDEADARYVLLEALVSSRAAPMLAAEFLDRAGQLTVVRRPPFVQAGGKSLPVVLGSRPYPKKRQWTQRHTNAEV
jgi:hypothetical protein